MSKTINQDNLNATLRMLDKMGEANLQHMKDTSHEQTEHLAKLGTLLSKKVAPGNSSVFVGNKEFEIMKKPGRGTHGHIAVKTNNVDRAVYHLGRRGVKFDMDSMVTKNGQNIAIYLADEVAGFAIHLVQK